MNKQLMIKIKDFLQNFEIPINYEKIAQELEKITKVNYKIHNCNLPVSVAIEPCEFFGRFGNVVDEYKICFNSSRIDALVDLKIDCFNSSHLDRIWNFYHDYKNNKKHTDNEILLYNFMQKYINLGVSDYFAQMGSYKTIKYELIETILHENQHVFQNLFLRQLLESKIKLSKSNLIMVFTVVFQHMYDMLVSQKFKFNYVRENYIFPIEFDARYNAMIQMNKVRELYFKDDYNFLHALKNSNIIPNDFDIDATVEKLFNDFVVIYKLYKTHTVVEIQNAIDYILLNEKTLKEILKKRYLEMIKISK